MRFIGKAFLFLFAFVGMLSSLGIVLVVLLVGNLVEDQETVPDDRGLLTFSIDGPLPERPTASDPLSVLLEDGPRPTLREVTEALAAAATDPNIQGLLVHLGAGPGPRMAQAQELREAILAFRASGKPTVVQAETIGEFGEGTVPYYIASAFETIWLQPSGMVAMTGFSMDVPFLRGLLDDLGIEPEVIARKEYKNAASSLTDYTMSLDQRVAMGAILDGWTTQVVQAIADERGLETARVRALVDQAPLLAREALDAGLVSGLGYRDEAEAALHEATGTDTHIPLVRYAQGLANQEVAPESRRVALIQAAGPIVLGDGKVGPLDTDEIDSLALAATIREAVNDPDISAIVLRIDSPGGSYVGSDIVWRAMAEAQEKGMPIVATMGDTAASGGYFIAMGADRIIAQPGTLTGSIGVLAGKVSLAKASEDLNIRWSRVSRGANADLFSPARPFDARGRERMDAILDAIYADFTTKAAAERGLSPEAMEEAARGRVWLGSDAVARGLVDELGGLSLALLRARELAGLATDTPLDVVPFPQDDTPEWLKGALGMARRAEGLSAVLGVAKAVDSILGPEMATLRAMDAGPLSSPLAARTR
jgi:protease-4